MDVPTKGLRPLWFNAKSAAKVQVTINPDDRLLVSDDLADRLLAADSHFRDESVQPEAAAPVTDETPAEAPKKRGRKPAADEA